MHNKQFQMPGEGSKCSFLSMDNLAVTNQITLWTLYLVRFSMVVAILKLIGAIDMTTHSESAHTDLGRGAYLCTTIVEPEGEESVQMFFAFWITFTDNFIL